jgi:hypothetical protein
MEAKNLTMVSPRSPYETINGFAILARTIDKCRAVISGTQGEYHFNCPLDKALFSFKGIDADAFKAVVEGGASDEEIGKWVFENGTPKTASEVEAWSSAFRTDFSYAHHPDEGTRNWFKGERLSLDPEKTTLFDYLEVDDKASFSK